MCTGNFAFHFRVQIKFSLLLAMQDWKFFLRPVLSILRRRMFLLPIPPRHASVQLIFFLSSETYLLQMESEKLQYSICKKVCKTKSDLTRQKFQT